MSDDMIDISDSFAIDFDVTTKRQRTSLLKFDLWMQLAVKMQEWANDIDPARIGDTPAQRGVRPFEEWEDDSDRAIGQPDYWHSLCRKYRITKEELAKVMTDVAQQVENKALHYDPDH
jgi:hypothetical protein